TMARRSRRLELERLEDRCTPATFGIPWPTPGKLTLSFVPDGTLVSGVPSSLFSTLTSQMATVNWGMDILRAFPTRAPNAGINLAWVSDAGAAMGAPGPTQGGSGGGDIRIAARPLGNAALAISVPYDGVDGWDGDVLTNTNRHFLDGGDGASGNYDLYTAILQ